MILALGARGPEFDSRNAPFFILKNPCFFSLCFALTETDADKKNLIRNHDFPSTFLREARKKASPCSSFTLLELQFRFKITESQDGRTECYEMVSKNSRGTGRRDHGLGRILLQECGRALSGSCSERASRDDEDPELAPVAAGDAGVVVEVGDLELAAPGVGRRPEVVGDAGQLQRRQLRQVPLGLHRRLLERDLDPRGP
jgi:hypothetical protein